MKKKESKICKYGIAKEKKIGFINGGHVRTSEAIYEYKNKEQAQFLPCTFMYTMLYITKLGYYSRKRRHSPHFALLILSLLLLPPSESCDLLTLPGNQTKHLPNFPHSYKYIFSTYLPCFRKVSTRNTHKSFSERILNIMKISAVFLLLLLLHVPLFISARHVPSSAHSHEDEEEGMRALVSGSEGRRKMKRGETVEEVAGSRLPDCSHACGSCSTCRLVMVSFVCASLQEAETCPMAYKCMCHDKSYPVP